MATLTGIIAGAGGAPYTKHVRFTLRNQPQVRGTSVIDSVPVDVQCGNDGSLSATLVIGEYWVQVSGGKPFKITIPEDGSYALSDVVVLEASIGSLFRRVYLKNNTTGLWHYIGLAGVGAERGITFDTTGTSNPLVSDPPNQFDKVYLWNPTTGLYHWISLDGSGSEVGITFDTTGTDSPPNGLYSNGLMLWNPDENRYRKLTCYGSGTDIGLITT